MSSDRRYRELMGGLFTAPAVGRKFGELLLEKKLLGPDQLQQCLQEQDSLRAQGKRTPLGEVCVSQGLLREDQCWEILALQSRSGETMDPQLSTILLRRYRLLREAGRGGMSRVYEGMDLKLHRRVAIKMISEDEETFVTRLESEARMLARLRHPNIVGIHEISRFRDFSGRLVPFIVMDFVEGGTFERVVQDGTLDLRKKIALFLDVVRAVAFAHGKGILHRDLKPANVLVDASGRVVLTDFGLARHLNATRRLTRDGELMGTPLYMAPEQLGEEGKTDERTDVYSLGVILYELLTGFPLFSAPGLPSLLHKILHEDAISPRVLNPGVPRDLEVICFKAIARKPGQRYAGVADLAGDLEAFLRGDPVSGRSTCFWYRAQHWVVKRKLRIGICASAVAVVLLVGALLLHHRAKQDQADQVFRLWGAVSKILMDAELHGRAGDVAGKRRILEEGETLCRRSLAENNTPESRYFLARLLILDERDSEARTELDRALAMNPDFGDGYVDRGLLALREYGRHWLVARQMGICTRRDGGESVLPELRSLREQAVRDLTASRGSYLYSRELDRRFGKAEIARLTGRFEQAEAGLREILAIEPLYGDALLSLSRIALEQDRPDDALEYAERARRVHLGSREAHLLAGNAHLQRGEFRLALADADRIGNPNGHESFLRALAKQALEDVPGAIEEYSRAVRLDPKLLFAYCNRGALRLRTGDLEGATQDMERALELNPRLPLLYVNRSLLRRRSGDAEGALADASRAIELDPLRAQAYVERAHAYRAQRDIDAALADVNRALQLDSGLGSALMTRGAIWIDRGDLPAAKEDFARATESDPKAPEAHYNYAYVCSLEGSWEAALEHYGRALELHPRHVDALLNRGKVHLRFRNWDAAMADWARVLEIQPNHEGAMLNRAILWIQREDYPAAIESLSSVVGSNPNQGTAHAYRAYALDKMGRRPEAREDARRATRVGMHGALPAEVRETVRRLAGEPE